MAKGKKMSLSAALQEASGHPGAPSVPSAAPPSAGGMAPSREGKKVIAGYFDPAVSRQLKQLALEEDSSIQDLLREALNDLFRKRGRSPIA
jgi:hypothetical protein